MHMEEIKLDKYEKNIWMNSQLSSFSMIKEAYGFSSGHAWIWHHLEFEKLHKGIGGLTIAKNKLRGEKSRNVFHIASQKSFKVKNKVKPVTTNLKKINIVNDEKVNRVNKAFIDVQKELANFSKGLSLDPLQKQLLSQQCHEHVPVNVDEARRLMAHL
ncbi:ribosomal biogenesis factor-like [Ovis canadensis]|uniref:ribosomal biogenesis factor-like n=1 Tax=Ovis canadensis TaxID=37174 RepID=UPI003752AE98